MTVLVLGDGLDSLAASRNNTTEQTMRSRGLSAREWCVLVSFAAMLAVLGPTHEPWPDEAGAWCLARDAGLSDLLLRFLRHEGHPALWYLLLRAAIHLHLSYSLFWTISCAAAVAGTWVMVRYAPFPFFLKALLPFTFFLGYQYAVVARSYSLFPVLGYLAAHLFRKASTRIVPLAIVLALLAQVSVHGTLVAIGFALSLAWRLWRGSLERPRGLAPAALIFTSSLLGCAVVLWPTSGALPRMGPTLNRVIDALSISDPHSSPLPGSGPLSPAATPAIPQPAPSSPIDPKAAAAPPGGARLKAVPTVLSYAFSRWWPLAVGFQCLLFVYLYRRGLVILALPFVLLAAFLVGVYGAPWHLGLLWVTAIMILWAAWDIDTHPQPIQSAVAIYLALLSMLQLPWTFAAYRFDARYPTSPDKALAAYLHTLPPGLRVAGFNSALGVEPYFPHNIFFNQHASFFFFSYDPFYIPPAVVMRSHPDLVVADDPYDALVRQNGYRQTEQFCGTLWFPRPPLRPACLAVYIPDASPDPPMSHR